MSFASSYCPTGMYRFEMHRRAVPPPPTWNFPLPRRLCILSSLIIALFKASRREEGAWGREQGKGEIAESPSLDVPESGKHPRPSKQTDRGSIVCSRKHACQYALIITYRGEHPNTRIFADRGEEAEIRICCEHRCSNIRTHACVCLCASGGVRR